MCYRFNCDSPSIELESRTPKGRGKRRGAANTPVQDTRTLRKGRRGSSAQTFTAPPSPAKSESSVVGGLKRKGRPQDIDLSAAEQRSSKRSRSGSQVPTPSSDTPPTDANGYIECPEPNCNKKYKNINGLRYHQSHAHNNTGGNSTEDSKEDMECEDIPLSVVKNSVKKEKKEKESKKEKEKSDSESKKSDKSSDQSNGKKSDKEESADSKDAGNKSDSKSDSGAPSKKKDKESNKGPSAQNGNTVKNGGSKSNGSNSNCGPVVSSQSSPNSVQTSASQATSLSSSVQPTSLTITSPNSNTVSTASQGDTSVSTTPSKPLVDIKPKITSDSGRVSKPNRPIVPAPPHTVLSNVQVTHSNLSPVMSHTQMSPQLKPIQPKPTIMGEPQNVNPALVDLNKDRKKSQKKKPKDNTNNGQNGAQARPDQPTIKIDRSGVIKQNPMPNKGQSEQQRKENSKEGSRPNDAQRSHNLTPHGHKSGDMGSRQNQNPNLLKVNSPLSVNTPDKGPVSDDVQSPAYSDISDANESASPAAPSDSSPQKTKDEGNSGRKEEKAKQQTPPVTEGQMMPHFGMYGYYGQGPYGMNNMSPGQKAMNPQGNPPNQVPQNSSNQVQDRSKTPQSTPGKDKQPEEVKKGEQRKPEGDKEAGRPRGPPMPNMSPNMPPNMPPHMAGPPPGNMTPQQMHEYQMYQQNMMYIQSLPQHMQYQYMGGNPWYPPAMDQNFVRMLDEQRRQQEQGRSERDGTPNKGQPGDRDQGRPQDGPKGQPMTSQSGPRKDDVLNVPKPMISPNQGGGTIRTDVSRGNDDKKKDQALRDKQNENHQILKENIDIKNEMDKRQQSEEMRRYRMYQEQKMIEERKKMDLARKSDGGRPENLTTKAPGTKPIVDNNSKNMPFPIRPGDIKKESSLTRDNNNTEKQKDSRESRESSAGKYPDRPGEEKSRTPVPDKLRSETPTRNAEMKRPGGSSSKSGSPSSSIGSSSVPGSPSYSPYNSYPPYMQNSHGYMPMDPMYRNHSVNPVLAPGYPGNPYIHPSQMGYRPGDGDDKDPKDRPSQKTPTSVVETDIKKGSEHGPYYGNVHKIHELSEKGRPKSRNSSPGPIKPSSGDRDSVTGVYDKHRDYTNSPPTQRHVHTHHHTHVLQPGPGLQPGAPLQGPPGFTYDPYSGE